MSAELIDGKQIAADVRERVAAAVSVFEAKTSETPGLAVVLGNELEQRGLDLGRASGRQRDDGVERLGQRRRTGTRRRAGTQPAS